MVVLSHISNNVSLDKSNTFLYLLRLFIVRAILCLKVNVAAVLVRSSAG